MMHRGVWRKSSNRKQGGPIPAVPAHARIITAPARAYLLPGGYPD